MITFIWGTMGAGKSARALEAINRIEQDGSRVACLKPALDTRDAGMIKSRNGVWRPAKVFENVEELDAMLKESACADVVVIDEFQFMTREQVKALAAFEADNGTYIRLYGLRTDFLDRLFPAVSELIADAKELRIEEIVCQCRACRRNKSEHNVRVSPDGRIQSAGETVSPGSENYLALCSECKDYAEVYGIGQLYKSQSRPFIQTGNTPLNAVIRRITGESPERVNTRSKPQRGK